MKKSLLFIAITFGALKLGAQCTTPADATAVTATPSTFCSNTSVSTDLNATAASGTIFWYTTPSGPGYIGQSASAANFNVTLSTTTTYYAEAVIGGGTDSTTYNYTGGAQYFVVPNGVDSITVRAWGAQGNSNALGVAGGLGGYSSGKIAVTSGDTVWIYVGGGAATSALGGYNGGANAGMVGCASAFGGGGGGASDVRIGGVTINDRIIVAGGGGGAGGNRVGGCGRGTGGGGGGGWYGGGGGAGWPYTNTTLPTGGTQSAGGGAGLSDWTSAPNNDGYPGSFGIGGVGGDETTSNQAGSGGAQSGGTGGGLTGSNGLYVTNYTGQSGAGGSGYVGSAFMAYTANGLRTGNGMVRIVYDAVCPSANRVPVTVTVNPLPNVGTTAAPSTSLCDGSSLTLSGTGAQSYTWSGPVSVTDNTPFTANTSAAGSYTVTGTDSNGCTNTSTVNIVVNTLPTAVVTASNTTVCAGDSVTLTGSGADIFMWMPGSSTASAITDAPAVTTTYTLTVTDTTTGCSDDEMMTINVNPLPAVAINPTALAICIGDSAVLTANGASTYSWSTGGNSATELVAPSASTTISVTGTDSLGCAAMDSIAVTVNTLPVVTVTAAIDTVCPGTADTLYASGADMYNWMPTGGTSSTEVVMPVTTTAYSVMGTDSTTGCSSTSMITVYTLPAPTMTVTATSSAICTGDGDTLMASGADAYSWSSGGNAATEFVNPTSTTTYTVTGTDSTSGCTSQSTITVTVNQLPNVTVSIAADTLCVTDGPYALNGGSPAGGTWSGTAVTGTNFSPSTAGNGSFTIIYTYTDSNTCTSTATDNIVVDPCVGIVEAGTPNVFQLYPNPASNRVVITWSAETKVNLIQITDITGRIVMTQSTLNGTQTEINISELPSGMYNVQIVEQNGVSTQRFIKE